MDSKSENEAIKREIAKTKAAVVDIARAPYRSNHLPAALIKSELPIVPIIYAALSWSRERPNMFFTGSVKVETPTV